MKVKEGLVTGSGEKDIRKLCLKMGCNDSQRRAIISLSQVAYPKLHATVWRCGQDLEISICYSSGALSIGKIRLEKDSEVDWDLTMTKLSTEKQRRGRYLTKIMGELGMPLKKQEFLKKKAMTKEFDHCLESIYALGATG